MKQVKVWKAAISYPVIDGQIEQKQPEDQVKINGLGTEIRQKSYK